MVKQDLSNNTWCIGIGAQKAGTTWLFRCLQEHPEIATARQKETHYFADSKNRDFAQYLSYFDLKKDGRVFLEISTSYLSNASAAKRIAEVLPNAKVIVLLRDPVERAFSHFKHLRAQNKNNVDSLESAISFYPEIIENGLYAKHLKRYFGFFDSSNLLILQYQDIKIAPQELIDSVTSFLGIKKFTPSILKRLYHSSRARSNPFYFSLVRIQSNLRKYRIGRLLVHFLKRWGIDGVLFDRIMTLTTSSPPSISEKEKEFLQPFFEKDQLELSRLFLNGAN